MNNKYGKKNITSFNNAHLASDIKRKNNTYNPPTYENETVGEEVNNLSENELPKEPSNLEKIKEQASNAVNSVKEEARDKIKKDIETKKKKAKKIFFKLYGKYIIIGGGALVALFGIILLIGFIPNAGGILELTNNNDNNNFTSKDTGTNIDVSGVVIGTDGLTPLTVSIVEAIGEDNYNKLNENVIAASSSNGCSKASMASVASTLAKELSNYGYRVPYYWGGGHSGAFYMGVDKSLGSATGTSCSDTNCYSHVGYDCSGFVSWALTMVLGRSVSMITNGFMQISTPITFAEASSGDILVSESHIVLVLQNNGSSLLTVESAGNNVGVIFGSYDQSRINSAGLQIKSMSSYFSANC